MYIFWNMCLYKYDMFVCIRVNFDSEAWDRNKIV